MDKSKPIILFGAGQLGARALEYFGTGNVHFFADNNSAGTYYHWKPVISFEDMRARKDEYNIVVSMSKKNVEEIDAQLTGAGITKYDWWSDIYGNRDFPNDPNLAKFKDMYKGRRCFVIGNGPSLRAEDLDTLAEHGEICFASNKIYKIFDQTKWRPDVFCVADPSFLEADWDTYINLDLPVILLTYTSQAIKKLGSAYFLNRPNVHLFRGTSVALDGKPRFSRDPSVIVSSIESVTYALIQWAVFMGVSEIYLLGVDHNYFSPNDGDGTHNHFYIASKEEETLNYQAVEHSAVDAVYRLAEEKSHEYGFRIFNATRGGMLEIFDRVPFDDLFVGKEI